MCDESPVSKRLASRVTHAMKLGGVDAELLDGGRDVHTELGNVDATSPTAAPSRSPCSRGLRRPDAAHRGCGWDRRWDRRTALTSRLSDEAKLCDRPIVRCALPPPHQIRAARLDGVDCIKIDKRFVTVCYSNS